MIGLSGLRPWRCHDCKERFYAWSVPIPFVHYAHCRQCGNLGVKRISSDYVTVRFAWLFRTLRLPAYRCAPCRNKFFSLRRHLRVVPEPQSPAPLSEAETESTAAPRA
jgi:DNA-directed RNA polymerase subunit RPC12/RpoP